MGVVNRASCLILDDDKILLVKSSDATCWQLPGSTFTESEPEPAALEGTRDITGVDAKIIQLFDIYERQVDGTNFRENVFEADISSEDCPKITAKEGFVVGWFEKDAARKEPLCPELKHVLEDL